MANITGDATDETLSGTPDADTINGQGGNDRILGLQGDDRLSGGDGDDEIFDSPSGTSDTASDMDVLNGGEGNDRLISNQGSHFQDNDTLNGDDGDDILEFFGTQTNDRADGGDGFDVLKLWLSTTSQTIVGHFNPAGFVIQLNGVNTLFADDIEAITVAGGTGSDILTGGPGADLFGTTGGGDTLLAEGGDDVIQTNYSFLSTAEVTFDGGAGEDRLIYQVQFDTTQPYVFDLPGGEFTRNGDSLGSIVNFERLHVTSGDGNDRLVGGDLDDFFQAGGGDNSVTGGVGNDNMNGQDGNDNVSGGAGDDTLGGQNGDDVLIGGAGNDVLFGQAELDTLNGGPGDDLYRFFVADDADDIIIDSSGTDAVKANLAELSIEAFAAIENLNGNSSGGQTLTGNAIANTITARLGNDTLSGLGGADTLLGNGGDDELDGGAGSDTLVGGEQADRLFGGAGADILVGDAPDVPSGIGFGGGILNKAAGAGNSAIVSAIDITNLFSLDENPDIIASTDLPHVTVNGVGGDQMDFYALTVTSPGVTVTLDVDREGLSGELDSEVLIFDAGGVELEDGDDSSTSLGGGGSDDSSDSYLIYTLASAGTFYFRINEWSDDPIPAGVEYRLHVSVGVPPADDTLEGGAGADTLDGGLGNDTATYSRSEAGVAVDLGDPAAGTGDAAGDTFNSIESLQGSEHADQLAGDGIANVLDGLGGNDSLSGLAGFDTLIGGGGNDTLDGGANPDNQGDIMLGGLGNDVYRADSALDLVDEGIVFGGAADGIDEIISSADFFWDFYSAGDVIRIAEDATDPEGDGTTIVGSVFSNFVVGNSKTNVLFGRGGSDTYIAGDGIDFISLSTLGLTDENAYAGVDGVNTVIVQQRTSGVTSYDIVFEFESGKDKVDLSDYGFASAAAAFATGVNDGAGNAYFILGDGFDYLYMVGLELADMSASDFVV